ncbi:MAG: NAD-dependent epimerase/dehydratase family protein [Phycisphaerales bacterium]|nr:NAD-dependent epimerase/dehydratase family protein [Phycisphaerales bacterium]
MNPGTIAITGASGLLGSALCARFASSGWRVRALSRTRPASLPPGATHHPCDLPTTLDESALDDAHAVIHAAYSMRSRSRSRDRLTNIEGSARVLAAARRAHARFVFVSSVSAHDAAQGFYGQSKLQVERTLDPARDLIIRPGLILSPHAGLFARMRRTIRSTGLAPLFGGGHQPVQTIHIDDLTLAFQRALELDLTGTLTVCEPSGLTIRDLFLLTARLEHRPLRVIPLPFGPAILALRTAEALRLRLPVSSDNLLGLRSMRSADPTQSLCRLGLTPRDAATSLADLLAPSPRPEGTA